jgi:hypothetical protein
MIDRWIAEYQNVSKLKQIQLNYSSMKRPKDYFNQYLALKLSEVGQAALFAEIEEMKAKNVFEHPEYYSRLKAEIKKMCRVDSVEQSNELIKELDNKILNVRETHL